MKALRQYCVACICVRAVSPRVVVLWTPTAVNRNSPLRSGLCNAPLRSALCIGVHINLPPNRFTFVGDGETAIKIQIPQLLQIDLPTKGNHARTTYIPCVSCQTDTRGSRQVERGALTSLIQIGFEQHHRLHQRGCH